VKKLFIFLFITHTINFNLAFAYVGPGIDLSFLSSLYFIFGTFIFCVAMLLSYPFLILIKKLKKLKLFKKNKH